MSFIVVIPSRYASSRLPGKPLLDIGGKPMIQHVYERALLSDASDVVIATDHAEIEQVAQSFGAKVCMTKQSHESGTDRLEEVASILGLADSQVIVNVQGDEPLIPFEVINQVAALMQKPDASMASLYEVIDDKEHIFDPNAVKVVTSEEGKALYFSRAPIPWHRDGFSFDINAAEVPSEIQYKRHIGIYGYRVNLLRSFVQWPVAALEAVEKLEQLRAMANGIQIEMAESILSIPAGVDTADDLDKVRAVIAAGG